MARITTTTLRARWHGADRWLSDGGARGAGRLTARITRDGVRLYYQYFHDGKLQRVPFGPYDETGARGLSLVQARGKSAQLAALYRGGATDLQGHLARERAIEERRRRGEEEAARRAEQDALRGTLRQLLEVYCDHLERQRKQAAKDARRILTTHLLEAVPELAARKASELTVDDFVGPIGQLVDVGKGRTAGKLRAYLRAAYQLALRSRTDPGAPLSMRSFGITTNPIASIGALSQFNRARDRVLSAPELGALLQRIDALPIGAQRDALQLLLHLGGQRPAQLVRIKPADVDLDAATVTLYDIKGARSQPRQHVLPLVKEAAGILARCLEDAEPDTPVLTTDRRTSVHPLTLSHLVSEVAATMVEAREARELFQLRDIRRTCETMLARLGVPSDIRAQLQSHGLGGVQQRHYDRHDYALEKRQALQKWARHLAALKAGKQAQVLPAHRAPSSVADRRGGGVQ